MSNKPKTKQSTTLFLLSAASLLFVFFLCESAFAFRSTPKVTCRIETDRAILPAGDIQNAIIKITLDAPPAPANVSRPPVNLSIVLDRSGSMSGSKIERAKEAAIEALKRLSDKDIFSLVVYDHAVNTIIPAQRAVNTEMMISKIRSIRSGGSTALFGGVSQGAAEVRKFIEGNYVNRIILLSDGLANVGPDSPADLGRLGAALIKENISVTTIGVGTDYNEDLMARLSQKSDGNIYFVESSYDLPKIFTTELGDVLNVVAKKVKVIIEVPEGIDPVSIIGREGRIKNKKIEISMNQLYGDQEKYALVEIQIPKSRSGQKMELANAKVLYENPFTKRNEIATGKSFAKFSDDIKIVEKSANVNVVREYELNLNALAEEKAISLSDKGKRKEAVQILKQSAAKLKSAGSLYMDEKLLEEAEQLETQADMIAKEGMSKKSRKVLRTKSYQKKNQQMSN